jgi:putative ABC transport system ATP-binding protein
MPILESVEVCKNYGTGPTEVQALRGVTIGVESGEFLAIMGPSGCGKSTLLHVWAGIEPPTSGHVCLDGKNLGGLSDTERSIVRRRRIGFVFQRINLLPTLTALENVAIPLRIDGQGRGAAHERARAALENVGIAHRAMHFPHEMSGGEQQRVAIARALVIRPAVIFADEPTGSLDSNNGQRIMDLLRGRAEQGQTVVMVTHDVSLARQADRVLQMRDGAILNGSPLADLPALSDIRP